MRRYVINVYSIYISYKFLFLHDFNEFKKIKHVNLKCPIHYAFIKISNLFLFLIIILIKNTLYIRIEKLYWFYERTFTFNVHLTLRNCIITRRRKEHLFFNAWTLRRIICFVNFWICVLNIESIQYDRTYLQSGNKHARIVNTLILWIKNKLYTMRNEFWITNYIEY